MLSSRSFIALALTFRSMTHFQLNLAYSVKQRSKFILLHKDIQLTQHSLSKMLFSLTELPWHSLHWDVGNKVLSFIDELNCVEKIIYIDSFHTIISSTKVRIKIYNSYSIVYLFLNFLSIRMYTSQRQDLILHIVESL